MKKFILAIILGMQALPAFAEKGDQYVIARVGMLQYSLYDADLGYGVGVYYGLGLWRDLSMELEVTKSVSGGEFREGLVRGKFDLTAGAAYAVYRAPLFSGTYIKAKLGYLLENISNNKSLRSKTILDSGASGGAGIGYAFPGGTTVEGEYTLLEKNISLYGVGMHYQF
ncbi:MAG: outer membrane beta-barrel protein [Gammaproteobacteria bacterium]|nr:outer membrane beta-barrel protein [Gammaproteobacteria bacterium]